MQTKNFEFFFISRLIKNDKKKVSNLSAYEEEKSSLGTFAKDVKADSKSSLTIIAVTDKLRPFQMST